MLKCLAKMETRWFCLLIDSAFELPLFSAMRSNRDKRESGENKIKVNLSHFVSSFMGWFPLYQFGLHCRCALLCLGQAFVSLPPWQCVPQRHGCPVSTCPMQLGLGVEHCWSWVLGLVSSSQTQWPFGHGHPWDCLLQSLCGSAHFFDGDKQVSVPEKWNFIALVARWFGILSYCSSRNASFSLFRVRENP